MGSILSKIRDEEQKGKSAKLNKRKRQLAKLKKIKRQLVELQRQIEELS